MLTPLETKLRLGLAVHALEPKHDLLRRLGLLVEHGLGLTSVTGLFAVVSALSLSERRGLNRDGVIVLVKEDGV